MTSGARRRFLRRFLPAAVLACLVLPALPAPARASDDPPAIRDTTWVDHDARPIPKPPDGEPDFYGHLFRETIVYPLSHAFDVPADDRAVTVVPAFGRWRAHPA